MATSATSLATPGRCRVGVSARRIAAHGSNAAAGAGSRAGCSIPGRHPTLAGPGRREARRRPRPDAAEAEPATARSRRRDGIALYIQAVGIRPDGRLSPVKAPESSLPHNIDAAVSTAMRAASSIKAAVADVRAAKQQLGVATFRFLPKIDAELAYSYQRGVDGVRGDNQYFTALLVGR